jgi:hypothetical protein
MPLVSAILARLVTPPFEILIPAPEPYSNLKPEFESELQTIILFVQPSKIKTAQAVNLVCVVV